MGNTTAAADVLSDQEDDYTANTPRSFGPVLPPHVENSAGVARLPFRVFGPLRINGELAQPLA